MRKILVILGALLIFTCTQAQSDLRLGVHLDLLSSWFSPKTPNIDKDGGRPGLSGGLMVEYYFHENYGLVSGISMTMLGGNLMYNDSVYIATGDNSSVLVNAGSTVAYRTNYLIIPVSLKLKTNQIGKFTYFAQLGLKQWFNMNAKATASGSGLSKDHVGKEINLYGMSYFFGGGIEFEIAGETSLTAGLFYDNGFTDVLSSNDHKAGLNFLTFRAGVFF